jgi:hypothetical protein
MIRRKGMVSMSMLTVIRIRDTGNQTFNMASELSPGLMDRSLRVSTLMGESTAEENTLGLTAVIMMESGITTSYKDTVHTSGTMVVHMRETGSTIKCTGGVFTYGKMGESMRENIMKIKSMYPFTIHLGFWDLHMG